MRAPGSWRLWCFALLLATVPLRAEEPAASAPLHPRLLLSFDEIETQQRWTPLMATVIDVPGEHGLRTGEEGAIERQGAGSEHHDPDSDSASAKAGAAAGVVRAIFSDHTLRLEKGTILDIRLDRPVQLRRR
jgi:hypothetical protein